MRLNEASAAALTQLVRAALALTGASVATNPSIVAMFGWIMPAPFAMPVTVTVRAVDRVARDAAFGTVSVVMIGFAAARTSSSSFSARDAAAAARVRCDRPAAAP